MTLRFRTEPRPHQRREFFAHREDKARIRIWSMRTGKSKSAIDDAAWLYHKGQITGVLVIAPNMVHANWVLKEFPTHCPVPYTAFTFYADRASTKKALDGMRSICNPAKKRLQVFAMPSSSVATANGKKFMTTFINRHKGRVLVVFDEAHDFKHPASARTKAARAVSAKVEYKRALTGTPISGSPLNAYAIYELLQRGALGFSTYEDFKGYFANWRTKMLPNGRKFPILTSYRNLEELSKRMEPFTSVVGRDEVKGLSGLRYDEVLIEMTPKQQKAYQAFYDNPVVNGKVVEGATFMSKLQQISTGFIMDHEGTVHELVRPQNNPRLQMAVSLAKNAPGKVIIWAKYKYEFKALAELLKAEEIDFCEIHGDMDAETDKVEVVYEFGKSKTQKVCIGNPASGGIGLDYSFVDLIIYCSHTFDLVVKSQADERGTGFGKNDVDIIHIVCQNSQDRYILNKLSDKADTSDIVIDDIQELKRRIRASNG